MRNLFQHLLPALLVSISLLAAGCNLNGQPDVIIVTATPAATEGPSPTPTLTPTPTIPPTPTIEPAVALRLADRYLVNGYYENAVAAYQMILAQGASAPQDIGAAAAFGLGRSALREGLFADAINALTAFIGQYPQDPRLAQAYFLRGDAHLGMSNWTQALADFEQYLVLRPGLIDSYVHERIADARLALGQAELALAAYAQAAEEGRSLVPQLALREKVARIYRTAGQPDAALAQYEAILAAARNAPYRAQIEYEAAQTLLESGDQVAGLSRLETIFNTYPDSPQAYQAMRMLTENGVELDDYARGRVSYFYGDYEGAIDAFNTYTTDHILAEVPAALYLLLGRAYREIGSSSAAVTAFQTVIDQYPTDPAFGEALLEQGRTKFLANDIDGAIAHYLNIADNYGYVPQAAEALWRAGYLYGTNDRPTESRQVFERLADTYPDTDQARSGLFLAASAAYKLDDLVGAERLYAKLAVTTTGDNQAAAYLWVGRLALQRGDQPTAEQAFRLAAGAAPDSYFAARAQDILQGRQAFTSPPAYRFEFDEAAQLAEAETWLREKLAITQEGSLWQLSPPLQADARLIRGNELWAVGAHNEAEIEFRDVIDAHQNNALTSFQLAVFLRGIGAYQPSILAAANVIRSVGVGTLEAPLFIARLRYPVYYLDVVLDAAQRRAIDPLLLFSLIRHESLFDTYATAAAGEKGLTQVIPSTAEYIAQQLQWPNYQHSDLFRPYAGVEFGAFYLEEQLRRFDENVHAALAGYNAGPGRAASWLQLSGSDPDSFMTAITIDSTRQYIERIYSFYTIYRALYGAT